MQTIARGAWVSQLLISAVLVAAALAAYDRWVVKPALRVGVIDLSAIYREKEKSYVELVTAKTASEAERAAAQGMVLSFAQRLPRALDELSTECNCLVLLRSALASANPNVTDLTPLLRHKIGSN